MNVSNRKEREVFASLAVGEKSESLLDLETVRIRCSREDLRLASMK